MSFGPAGKGRVTALVRRLSGAPDPLAIYRAVSNDGRRSGSLLFETADSAMGEPARSFVLARAALSATCRGREVVVRAFSANGEAALSHVVSRASSLARVVQCNERRAILSYPPRTTAVALHERLAAPSPLDALRALGSFEPVFGAPPHAVLCAGAFAYDFIDAFEALPEAASDPLQFPDYTFFLAESLIVIDPKASHTEVICTAFGCSDGRLAQAVYNDASARLADLVALTTKTLEQPDDTTSSKAPAAPDGGSVWTESVDLDDAAFAEKVLDLKEHIANGDVFQIVPSRTFVVPCPSPIDAYEALRSVSPSPYMFFVAGPDHTLFGASPETSVRVWRDPDAPGTNEEAQLNTDCSGSGPFQLEIRPIAGTRRRGLSRFFEGLDLDLDNRHEAELLLDDKERAEHIMLVDLARNDVARTCAAGSRHVERLLTVERFSHVMHLVSSVTGRLKPNHDALSAYAAAMNMGTLTGAPKVRAASLLREHEATKRGPYGGAIGYFTGHGELDTAVVIRSALVKDGTAYVRAGAGVVFDSDPLAEAKETQRKAASVLSALRKATTGTERESWRAVAQAGIQASKQQYEVVLIDNFDSFTFNLVEAFERLGCRVQTLRNTISAQEIVRSARERGALLVLSPGPGGPREAGSCMEIVTLAKGLVPLFGVCLGHQAIVLEAGGVVSRADTVVHGKTSRLVHDGTGPFEGIASPMLVGRYHSLATTSIPPRLHVHAAISGMAMAVSDTQAKQIGVQFHPESILTPKGQILLQNILAMTLGRKDR